MKVTEQCFCCTVYCTAQGFSNCNAVNVILKCDHSDDSCWALLSCATVYYAEQVGSVLLVTAEVKTTLGCHHSNENCWEVLSFGAVTNAISISNIVFFYFFIFYIYIFRWSPSCYILLKPSAVWGYTSLRIWDHLTVGRVSASLSRSALIYMIRLKFSGIKL